jgi:hypothetical protein
MRALLGWLTYGVAMSILVRAIWRAAREADSRHAELERRRQEWGHWP